MANEGSNQKRKRGVAVEVTPSDASRRAAGDHKTKQRAKATMVADMDAHVAQDRVRRSKRDRRSTDDNPWWISGSNGAEEQQDEAGDGAVPPNKRARLSRYAAATVPKKQTVRSRQTDSERSPVRARSASSPPHSKLPSAPATGTTAQPSPEHKRRGRPRKSDIPKAGMEEAPIDVPPRRRGGGRSRMSNVSKDGQTPAKTKSTKAAPTSTQRTKKATPGDRRASQTSRRRVSDASGVQDATVSVAEMDDELEASLLPVPRYRHIEPQTRQISKATIKAKWAPLDAASIDAVSTILSDTTRPVLLRLRDKELRHQQGQNILRIVARRLQSKLRKGMPFPPPTTKMGGPRGVRDDAGGEHVEELDFERIVDSIESLETMLNPLLHSVALLEKEKAKEETALEREYETLRTLESNARAEARNWRERMKKAHSLAPKPSDTDTRKFAARDAGELVLSKQKNLPLPGLFTDTKDEELLSTSQQIASHMESIQKNVQPIQEVLPAIARSRAALQSVLQTHLSPQQLDRILIG